MDGKTFKEKQNLTTGTKMLNGYLMSTITSRRRLEKRCISEGQGVQKRVITVTLSIKAEHKGSSLKDWLNKL